MSRTGWIWLVLALWLAAMAGSALALMAEPVGDGFTRGMNRVTGFLAWQLAAAVLALVAWIAARPVPKGALLRWLARVPAFWCLALLLAFVGMIGWSFVVDPG